MKSYFRKKICRYSELRVQAYPVEGGGGKYFFTLPALTNYFHKIDRTLQKCLIYFKNLTVLSSFNDCFFNVFSASITKNSHFCSREARKIFLGTLSFSSEHQPPPSPQKIGDNVCMISGLSDLTILHTPIDF